MSCLFPATRVGEMPPSRARLVRWLWTGALGAALTLRAAAGEVRLGPLFTRSQSTSQTVTAIHPLLAWGLVRQAGDGSRRYVELLYPLGRWQVRRATQPRPRETRLAWLMPLYYDKQTSEGGALTRRTVVFPLWYSGRREPGGAYQILLPFYWHSQPGARLYFPLYEPEIGRTLALWPLAGEFRGAFNADRVRFALWPLWVESVREARPATARQEARAAERSTTLLWPVLGWTRGTDGWGWKVWPLVSWRARRDGTAAQLKFLWPLGHWVRRPAGGAGAIGAGGARGSGGTGAGIPIESRALLPLWLEGRFGHTDLLYATPLYARALTRSPQDDRVREIYRGWLWPLVSRRDNLDTGAREWRLLHILGIWRSDPADQRWQLFPLAGQRTLRQGGGEERRGFALAPFCFWRTTRHADGSRFERRYLFPLLIDERWTAADGAPSRRRLACLPFVRYVWRAGGGSDLSAPHLLWFTSDEGLLRNWAPLWTLYRRQRTAAGAVRHEALWGLLHWGDAAPEGGEEKPSALGARESVVNALDLADNAQP